MARSQKQLHDDYKKRGGKKSFAEFNKAVISKMSKKPTAATKKKINAKKKINMRPYARKKTSI